MVDASHYILLAGVLFTIGVVGVLVRRNILVVLMALGLMFNAAILVFAAFGRLYPSGEVMALLVLAVSSVGLGVGVALGVLGTEIRHPSHVTLADVVAQLQEHAARQQPDELRLRAGRRRKTLDSGELDQLRW